MQDTACFAYALAFVIVVIATRLAGRKIASPPFEFASPLRPATAPGVWDRLGLWTAVAVVLIAVAYARPLARLPAHPRFGSPPFKPF